MLRCTLSWTMAALVIASSCGMAAAPAPEPEVMDNGTTLRRVETRSVTDARGRKFEMITWMDAYGRRSLTVEPTGQARATGMPIEMDGVTSGDAPADMSRLAGGTAAESPTGPGRWTSIGPDGGTVTDVNASPIDPRLMLAGTANDFASFSSQCAVYRSTDGGATWAPSLILDGWNGVDVKVYEIVFSPEGIAYAATGQGVFRTRDGGVRWDWLLSTREPAPALAVAVDPVDSRRLWVGLSSPTTPVMRSIDGGATWSTVPLRLSTPLDCRTIAMDASRPGVVALGFGTYPTGKLWVSPDDGVHWTDRSAGLPGTPVNRVLIRGQQMLAATGEWVYGADNGGLYLSTNDGATWRSIGGWPRELTAVAEDVAMDPADPCVMWVANRSGLFHTGNCGLSWTYTSLPAKTPTHSVRVVGSKVLVGTETDGVWKREGTGQFAISSHGIRELNVLSVVANPQNPNELAAALSLWNSGGVYISLDRGQTWNLEPYLRSRIGTVEFGPDGLLYAVALGPTDINGEGLYRRDANGTWVPLGPNRTMYFETVLHAVCFDPEQPGLVIAGGTDYLANPPRMGIWRSTNGGSAWDQVWFDRRGIVEDLAIAGTGASRAIIASIRHSEGQHAGRVLRSTDLGISWSDVPASQLPANPWPGTLKVSRQDPNRVFLSNYNSNPALLRSDDAGRTWKSTGYPGAIREFVIHPDDDHVLYGLAAEPGRPIIRSQDSGESFEPFFEGVFPTRYGSSISLVDGECPLLLRSSANAVDLRAADIERPHVSLRVDPNELWPPNHQMVEVHAQVVVSDACDPAPRWRLVSVEGGDPGDVEGAAIGEADLTFSLRAARAGSGARTYAITYEAEDESGNTERRTTFVVAPHDQSGRRFAAGGSEVTAGSRVDAVSEPRVIAAASGLEVRFGLRRADRVRVEVFDLLGARVRTLWDGGAAAGEQVLRWDGRDANGRTRGSGVYLVRVRGAEIEWKGKAVLVR